MRFSGHQCSFKATITHSRVGIMFSKRLVTTHASKNPNPTTLPPTSTPTDNASLLPQSLPTLIPRKPGVTDGPWDKADQTAVEEALLDAKKIARQYEKSGCGPVILGQSLDQLKQLAALHGQPAFRAKQLQDAIVFQGIKSIEDITNIPKAWKEQLIQAGLRTGRSIVHHQVTAKDGTRKFLLQTHDGLVIETVGIPSNNDSNNKDKYGNNGGNRNTDGRRDHKYNNNSNNSSNRNTEGTKNTTTNNNNNNDNNNYYNNKNNKTSTAAAISKETTTKKKRLTVCVSSEIGCPLRCVFCATGKGGFSRNLLPHEIIDQVLTVQEQFKERVSNIVFMGMGEPLLNLPSVVAAFKALNEDVKIGARHITISTVGVPNTIKQLAKHKLQITLAVSLHAPTQELRRKIVPSAAVYPIEALMADCKEYSVETGRRVSFEYTLLAGVNDQVEHGEELVRLLKRWELLQCHVNVIPWNPVDESEFERPSKGAVHRFVQTLEGAGVAVNVRQTRGLEAAAACGQLRNRYQKQPLEEFTLPG